MLGINIVQLSIHYTLNETRTQIRDDAFLFVMF